MSQEEKDKLQKVGVCLSALGIANSMLMGYRGLFLVIEAILLSLGIGLLAVEKTGYIGILGTLGLIFCFAAFFLFSWGRRRVDYWRDRIFEEVKGTDLEEIFEIYRPTYIWKIPSPVSPRFWLDLLSPTIIVAIWILILWMSCG